MHSLHFEGKIFPRANKISVQYVHPCNQAFFSSFINFLQIALPRAHYVSKLFLELRGDNCCGYNNAFIEARVGMVDTAGMELQDLTVNQVRVNGRGKKDTSCIFN